MYAQGFTAADEAYNRELLRADQEEYASLQRFLQARLLCPEGRKPRLLACCHIVVTCLLLLAAGGAREARREGTRDRPVTLVRGRAG